MDQLKKVWRFLRSMKFAVILLLILAAACTAGSVIPQGQPTAWYTEHYAQQAAGAVMLLGLDDVFHCWWFVALTLFLCLNLLLCSVLRFPALLRRMREGFTPARAIAAWDWAPLAKLEGEPERLFAKLGFHSVRSGKMAVHLPDGNSGAAEGTEADEAETDRVEADGAETDRVETDRLKAAESADGRPVRYAVKYKAGLWGAWLCHLGMLVVIAGFGLGQMFKSEYTVYGVPGQTKPVGDTGYELTIDDFSIALRDDDTVDQYTSEITVTDTAGGEQLGGSASVNAPLSLFGMKFYQNSTGWAATLETWKDGKKLQEDLLCAGEYAAIADLEGLAVVFNAFYPDYAEDESGQPVTLSSALKNPGYLYTIYYHDQVVGMNVLTAGEKITVEDYEFIFRDPQPYTLIQVKRDPFRYLAAAGGLLVLCALILAFYLYPRELWAVQDEDGVWCFGGRSAKAGLLFAEEIGRGQI